MEEEWRDIEGYEGLYQVSNLGRVKSLLFGKELLLKQNKTSDKKYWKVNLYNDGNCKNKRVHVLVAKAFPDICGDWFEGAVCNHKDENGLNNNALNIEVCTNVYNTNYGTGKQRMGEMHKKPVCQYSKNGEFIKEYSSALDAEKETGIDRQTISSCCHYRKFYRSAGGYKWSFR